VVSARWEVGAHAVRTGSHNAAHRTLAVVEPNRSPVEHTALTEEGVLHERSLPFGVQSNRVH